MVASGISREKPALSFRPMAVNSTHPDYDANLPAWLRARDVFAGEDAPKAAGERYLPRLDAQLEEEPTAINDKTL